VRSPEELVKEIRTLYPTLSYDHRPFLTYKERHEHIRLRDATEDYRIKYACFKYAVASVLKPSMMLEIGVRGGCSALAFLHACPSTRYLGIDSDCDGVTEDGLSYISTAEHWFEELGFKATILVGDSQRIHLFPSVDFIHIDACHSRECTRHDVLTAITSGIRWILVDDSNADTVDQGVGDAVISPIALNLHVKRFDFPETQGGNTLLHLEKEEA
jgi:hypothetical protein